MRKQRELDGINGFYNGPGHTMRVPTTVITGKDDEEEAAGEGAGGLAVGGAVNGGKSDAGFPCPWKGCDLVCQTERGLQSHLRGHRRRAKNALQYSDKVRVRPVRVAGFRIRVGVAVRCKCICLYLLVCT